MVAGESRFGKKIRDQNQVVCSASCENRLDPKRFIRVKGRKSVGIDPRLMKSLGSTRVRGLERSTIPVAPQMEQVTLSRAMNSARMRSERRRTKAELQPPTGTLGGVLIS